MSKQNAGAGECLAFLEEHDDFLVTGHPYADGDSIGSTLAMCEFLELAGKSVRGILFGEVPIRYAFLDRAEELLRLEDGIPDDVGALVCVDVGSVDRIDRILKRLREGTPILNLDHHTSNRNFGTTNWNDTAVSCVGQMLYDIFTLSDRPISRSMAECIYVSIVTDTGRFCYRNTTARTLEIASRLIGLGVNCATICQNVFESGSHPRLRFLARALSTIETTRDEEVCWLTLTQEMYEQTGAMLDDSYEFIDLLKSVRGTRLAMIFREMEDGRTKVSVRTNASISGDELCGHFGGGGHRCAAGAIVDMQIDAVIRDVLKVADRLLEAGRE